MSPLDACRDSSTARTLKEYSFRGLTSPGREARCHAKLQRRQGEGKRKDVAITTAQVSFHLSLSSSRLRGLA